MFPVFSFLFWMVSCSYSLDAHSIISLKIINLKCSSYIAPFFWFHVFCSFDLCHVGDLPQMSGFLGYPFVFEKEALQSQQKLSMWAYGRGLGSWHWGVPIVYINGTACFFSRIELSGIVSGLKATSSPAQSQSWVAWEVGRGVWQADWVTIQNADFHSVFDPTPSPPLLPAKSRMSVSIFPVSCMNVEGIPVPWLCWVQLSFLTIKQLLSRALSKHPAFRPLPSSFLTASNSWAPLRLCGKRQLPSCRCVPLDVLGGPVLAIWHSPLLFLCRSLSVS